MPSLILQKARIRANAKAKGLVVKPRVQMQHPRDTMDVLAAMQRTGPSVLITTSVVAAKHPQVDHVPKEGTFVSGADVSKHMHFAKLMAVISRSSPSD